MEWTFAVLVLLANLLFVVDMICCQGYQFLGTGSSRLEEEIDRERAAEYKEMIEDKEHIQEEFDNMFTKQQMRLMTSEEMAFTWFRYAAPAMSKLDAVLFLLHIFQVE